jgi:hypothetical protein
MALAVEGENSDTRASNNARPDLCAAGPCAPSTASLTSPKKASLSVAKSNLPPNHQPHHQNYFCPFCESGRKTLLKPKDIEQNGQID